MTRAKRQAGENPLFWVGSAKRDLLAFPAAVQHVLGTALSVAQFGGKHPAAKPWKGEGPGVYEIVADHRGDTFRTVYTVRFEKAIYVLHVFQKKSPRGVSTRASDKALIAARLRAARQAYEENYGDTNE